MKIYFMVFYVGYWLLDTIKSINGGEKEEIKIPFFYKLDTNIGTFKDWVITIALAITSIMFFFKSF